MENTPKTGNPAQIRRVFAAPRPPGGIREGKIDGVRRVVFDALRRDQATFAKLVAAVKRQGGAR